VGGVPGALRYEAATDVAKVRSIQAEGPPGLRTGRLMYEREAVRVMAVRLIAVLRSRQASDRSLREQSLRATHRSKPSHGHERSPGRDRGLSGSIW
jgi:hypothetical protein